MSLHLMEVQGLELGVSGFELRCRYSGKPRLAEEQNRAAQPRHHATRNLKYIWTRWIVIFFWKSCFATDNAETRFSETALKVFQPSLLLSIYLSIYLCTYLSMYVSIYRSIYNNSPRGRRHGTRDLNFGWRSFFFVSLDPRDE